MPRSITIRRWCIEWYQRAIHIAQTPNPRCDNCGGDGGWWDGGHDGESPEPVTCHCTNRLRHYRLQLWRRNPADYATEAPF